MMLESVNPQWALGTLADALDASAGDVPNARMRMVSAVSMRPAETWGIRFGRVSKTGLGLNDARRRQIGSQLWQSAIPSELTELLGVGCK